MLFAKFAARLQKKLRKKASYELTGTLLPAIILASLRCLPGANEVFGRRGREVEGTPLLREHLGQNLDRGFESLRLRQ
ncbi:hypothetical protein PUN4_890016 [Paraburkholderia unamae]|nr:hypothetical protein PUN4_890016 [Paraburkholderia unamae]